MVFTRRLRDGIKLGRITISIRFWLNPRVKVGNRYAMDEGHVVIDAVEQIRKKDITARVARESGFASVDDLLSVARHGKGEKIFLVRFHYLRPGEWDRPAGK